MLGYLGTRKQMRGRKKARRFTHDHGRWAKIKKEDRGEVGDWNRRRMGDQMGKEGENKLCLMPNGKKGFNSEDMSWTAEDAADIQRQESISPCLAEGLGRRWSSWKI